MGYRQLMFVLICGIASNYSIAQKKNNYENVDRYLDSIVLDYLVKYFPNDSISKKEIVRNGKTQKIRKYYDYLSFKLHLEDKSKDIKIVNFGAYIEHTPNFMLVVKMSNNILEEHFILGKKSLEEDMLLIQAFFSSLSDRVKEKYKLEIMNIFLQSRQGIAHTSRYIH